jgi:ubiquinone/menaquinone biosynthesis C-methylase UbiE
MSDLAPDQLPDGWSDLASGYDTVFTKFTGPFADELLDRIGVEVSNDFIDIAAGSGVVSVRAARRGAKSVFGTDFAPGMVELLDKNLVETGHPAASAAVMDGQNLEVDDASFDRATSLFGVIFFPDLAKGFSELHRVLRPNGRVGVTAWNAAQFPWIPFIGQALAQTVEGFTPPDSQPPIFRISDAETLGTHLARAGFGDVEIHEVVHRWTVDDPAQFFVEIPTWAPPMAPLFASLDDEVIARASEVFAGLLDGAAESDGAVPTGALIGIGTR